MTPRFLVRTTPRYDRLVKALARAHPAEYPHAQREAITILETDATNVSRKYHIKKLVEVAPGDGQWRLRLRRFRFRYDVEGRTVTLRYGGLRREDTYR